MGFGRVWLRKRRKEMWPFLDMQRERGFLGVGDKTRDRCSLNNFL
jgi:hypothetical protein